MASHRANKKSNEMPDTKADHRTCPATCDASRALSLIESNAVTTPKTREISRDSNFPEPTSAEGGELSFDAAGTVVSEFLQWLQDQAISGLMDVDRIEYEFYEFAWANGHPLIDKRQLFTLLAQRGVKRLRKQLDLSPDDWRYRLAKRRGVKRPRRSLYNIPSMKS